MTKTNFLGKAVAIAMMLLGLTFVSCDEQDNPLPSDWDGVTPNLPLTLEAVAEDGTMNVTFVSTLPEVTTIEYSIDGGKSWRVFTISGGKPRYEYGDKTAPTTEAETPAMRTISSVHQILLRGYNETYGSTEKGDLRDDYIEGNIRNLNIIVNTDCYIYGNIMSLVDGDNFTTRTDLKEDHTFAGMFSHFSANLKNHPTKKLLLPATTLTEGCYAFLFQGCSGITASPDLPATTLTDNCYQAMFYDTGLKVAPSLPATTLADNCYSGMFANCTALTKAPDLPATKLAKYCYINMFSGTKMTTAPELPATEMTDSCYYEMFSYCTALTTAPKLPAKKLAKFCYTAMFSGCTALTTAPEELPATELEDFCYYGMFKDCSSLVKAPVLPAKELKNYCYAYMFYNCKSLNYIKCLATSIADGAYGPTGVWSGVATWGTDVPAGGTFVIADKTKYGAGEFWDPTDYGFGNTTCNAPTGWTAKNPDEE